MISNTLTLKQLEALVWVADLGSFRKAAAHLGTTQPNISARIAALEATLGFSLMARDAGSVEMTPRGLDVLEQARKSLRAVEGVLDVAARPDLAEDRLRLGVTELIATTWLHDFLRALRQDYPRVTVELTVDLSRTLDAELAANALDLALQNAPFSHAATGEITLGSYGYAWVAAPDLMSGIDPSKGVAGLTAPHPGLPGIAGPSGPRSRAPAGAIQQPQFGDPDGGERHGRGNGAARDGGGAPGGRDACRGGPWLATRTA